VGPYSRQTGAVTRVVLLGTGTPVPDPERCGSGVAIVREGMWVLVDCGRGVTQRAMQAGLDLRDLGVALLTHHHSDHVSDLATLAIARWVAGALDPLTVIAPNGPCARFAIGCLDAYEDQAFYAQAGSSATNRPAVSVVAFDPSGDPSCVFSGNGWSVSAALVDHHPIEAAVGYRIEVDTRIVAISGDTAVCDGVARLAAGADLLVHEAVRSDLSSPRLLEWNASARSVGSLADSLALRRVVLTHLLPAPLTAADCQAFVDETRDGGYMGDLVLARDLMVLQLDPAA
jgi:ribonuclease Z